jgi:hypothetical protein
VIDLAGDDTYQYQAGTQVTCPSPDCNVAAESVNGAGSLGVGALVDGGGTDTYVDQLGGAGTDKTVVPKGTLGAQIDTDGLVVS